MKIHNWPRAMFEYQAPAVLNQATPVNGTFYTILDTTKYVRVYDIGINIEDADEDLEVQVTVDGETIAASAATCTHSTSYFCVLHVNPITRVDYIGIISNTNFQFGSHAILEGHSVKIEVRKTSANGAGNLTGIVTYGVLKNV
jgi:hypothetical protein